MPLDSHVSDLSRTQFRQDCEEPWDERQQIHQAVGARPKDHRREETAGQSLLERHVAIDGDEDIAEPFKPVEQGAIVDRGPAMVAHCRRVEVGQVAQQRPRNAVIEHDARAALRGRSVGVECLPGEFEHGDGVLPGHVWKVREERIERVAALEVIDQRLDRHSGARKYSRAAQAVGRAGDEGAGYGHRQAPERTQL